MKKLGYAKSIVTRATTCGSLLVLSAMVPAAAMAQSGDNAAQQRAAQSNSQQQNSGSAAQKGQAQGSRASRGNQQGQSQKSAASSTSASQSKGMTPNPYAKADDSWISISGTVAMVERDAFTLDYGDGSVRVEMDDRDRDSEAYSLLTGDKVTVNGMIDDDTFETTKIEASSVHVDKLGTTFYASALDEEDFHVVTYMVMPEDYAAVHGLVTEVSGDEFTIDTGPRSVRVDIDEMSNNPLDDDGYQKVEVGDIVRVTGRIDDGFFEGREIKASTISTLVEELG